MKKKKLTKREQNHKDYESYYILLGDPPQDFKGDYPRRHGTARMSFHSWEALEIFGSLADGPFCFRASFQQYVICTNGMFGKTCQCRVGEFDWPRPQAPHNDPLYHFILYGSGIPTLHYSHDEYFGKTDWRLTQLPKCHNVELLMEIKDTFNTAYRGPLDQPQ